MNPDILSTPYHYSTAWTLSSPKRKAEFEAGRLCAARAIERMNPKLPREVGTFPDGSPHWPEGIVGSITHTEGFASAAVASVKDFSSLGIDSEKLADPKILESVKDVAIQDGERHFLTELPFSKEQTLILIFSAKESIYKCLYPLVKRRFDYATVCLDSIHAQNRTFRFHFTESLNPKFPAAFTAEGRFEFSLGCVHTGVELRKASTS